VTSNGRDEFNASETGLKFNIAGWMKLSYSPRTRRTEPGQTRLSIHRVEYLGTYKSQEEINADGNLGILRQGSGWPTLKDENGDGIINNDDHVVKKKKKKEILEPPFFGGINTIFVHRNFSLDVSGRQMIFATNTHTTWFSEEVQPIPGVS
jgi:hypothetical protein